MNQLDMNKKNVLEFFDNVVNKKDFAAARSYLGDHYIQHHPYVADGFDGLKQAIQVLRDQFPHVRSEIKRVFAEGDYVILHLHLIKEPNSLGFALADMYRLEAGKIVEHWCIAQEIPANIPHNNGVF